MIDTGLHFYSKGFFKIWTIGEGGGGRWGMGQSQCLLAWVLSIKYVRNEKKTRTSSTFHISEKIPKTTIENVNSHVFTNKFIFFKNKSGCLRQDHFPMTNVFLNLFIAI